jgi:hypothetical protein
VSRPLSKDGDALRAFWAVFHARSGPRRCALRTRYARWREAGTGDLMISQYVTNRSVGVFLRGPKGEGWRTTARRLTPWVDALCDVLDTHMGQGFLFPTRAEVDTADDGNWIEMADWLHHAGDLYVERLGRLGPTLGSEAA